MTAVFNPPHADDGAGKCGPVPVILSRRGLLGVTAASAAIIGLGFVPSTARAATTTVRYVQTPHGRIAYAIDGARRGQPPLVLLHRFRGAINDWDPQFVALMRSHRQTIRFDSAGVGRSDGTPAETVEDMAAITGDVMAALGIARADVLGWSMGSFVGQELALRAPREGPPTDRRRGAGPDALEAPHAKALLHPDAGHAFLFQYAADFTAEVDKFLGDA